ncbi:hypothetical protein LL3_04225 [Bacillus amyloliquefaciens LL3]|nr:hypothetical protein LL3_04225 [Bacillus amyloliquefaciens LL3]
MLLNVKKSIVGKTADPFRNLQKSAVFLSQYQDRQINTICKKTNQN